MDDLKQFYTLVGADAAEVVARLCGDSALVKKFLMKFKTDRSFSELCDALDNNDTETAFRAAHTLKGICANLGIRCLFEQASVVTELLRNGDIKKAKESLPTVIREYNRVDEALKNLKD